MYLTPLGLALKNAPGVFVVVLISDEQRGQLSCSNALQTHLSINYVGWLHCVLSVLSDTKIAASSGGDER